MQEVITRKTKKTSLSKMKMSYSIMPTDLNTKGTIYGARLLEYADNLAGSVAIRHSRCPVTTASVDSFDFLKPFKVGQFLFAEAFVSGVGNQSIEICVKFIGEEDFSGERFLGALAFLTFRVKSLGPDEKVPLIEPENEEEEFIMKGYCHRRKKVLDKIEKNKELTKKINLNI